MISEVTVQDEVAQMDVQGQHVVILWAGAGVAACPQGDVSGRRLLVMNAFLDIVDLGDLPDVELRDLGSGTKKRPDRSHR